MSAEAAGAAQGWWRSYFDRDFLRLYRPFLTPERTWEEVSAVLELLDLPDGARVLDLACGWGRHAVALAAAELRVVGVDRSMPLLQSASRLAAELEASVGWVRADMGELPLRPGFDAVVSIFSSLGYAGAEADAADLRTLREARRVLRPGGALLLETMHRDSVVRGFAERDWWQGEAGEHVWVERELDAVAGVSREWLRWTGEHGAGEKFHEIRIRNATEWAALLRQAELEPVEWYGDWDLSAFEAESERLIVLARAG